MKTKLTQAEYRTRFAIKNERCGSASNFQLYTLRMLPDVIQEVDGYPVVFDGTTTDHRRGDNYFGGATWELPEEKCMPRSGCEIKTAIEILKKVLEIHIPAAQLGRPFLGTSITAVSICIMPSVHEM